MPVVGIVAEYNPLHSGHAYHISRSIQKTGADAAVCVLSSQFVQRGEPALISKQARTRMALMNGIDLVIELPSAFSCSSAEYFSSGAVKLLDSLGVVDFLSFGSEEGRLDSLEKAADLLAFETPAFKAALREALDSGCSFPLARQAALKACLDGDTFQAVSKPNNILGIEYLKALKRLGSPIKPVTIGRVGQGYRDEVLGKSFSSATAIRNCIKAIISESCSDIGRPRTNFTLDIPSDLFSILRSNLPESSLDILQAELRTGRGPIFAEDFENILLYRLRSATDEELAALPYIEEGLDKRLRKAALIETSLDSLVKKCTTSRYPSSRINRILCALLLNMTDSFLNELKNNGYAQYIRVLGFNEKGRRLLATARKKATLPIIIKPSFWKKLESPLARRLFEYEIKATDIYCLAYKGSALRKGGSELTTSPVLVL